MGGSPAIAMLSAVALCVCAESACAKNARARQPAAHRLLASSAQPVRRKKPPIARTPVQDEKSWMDRASAVSSGGGGMGM